MTPQSSAVTTIGELSIKVRAVTIELCPTNWPIEVLSLYIGSIRWMLTIFS